MSHPHAWRNLLFLSIVLGSCAPPTAPTAGSPAQEQELPSKTLIVTTRAEPQALLPKQIRPTGFTAGLDARMVNAGLVINNDSGLPVPYLAETAPQLSTDSWRVFPDGRMETTYRLKANLTWHDGQPLTADDFLFSHQVYSSPELGQATAAPINLMDRVAAPDPRSVVIYWKKTYPDAADLQATNFPPLPRHVLGKQFESQDPDAFLASPFFSQQYIGVGPYKLDRWEAGAFLEGIAFDRHILGKPKISRIRELFVGDQNTIVANVLAGTAHFTSGDSIRFEQGQVLQQQWGDSRAGTVLLFPGANRKVNYQLRPEYASTRAFSDLRVRQALTYGIDRDSQNEALFGGQGMMAWGSTIQPTVSYFADVDKAVTKYPFDPRKTELLMTEAGFAKGPDGVWTSPTYGRMAFEMAEITSVQNSAELHIMADTWRRLSFDPKEIEWNTIQSQDFALRNTFPAIWTGGGSTGDAALASFRSDRTPTAANRWTGGNLGGWVGTPEYDRFVDIFETTLDLNQRNQAAVQMAKIITDQCVFVSLYFNLVAQAFTLGLTGPRLTDPNGSSDWNLHEWEFR